MDQRASKGWTFRPVASIEEILETHYAQLLKWGEILARGDEGVAQEIVHDLCVQLTLSKPDFTAISKPDGYLYTCLRHVYLSRLARASRDSVRFINIADCDSLCFAVNRGQGLDALEIQNQLRSICLYAIWRKEFSKSYSYFILHFFHGYYHREIAELSRLPVAAIYNKLKSARTELQAYLADPDKLRFTNRENPPKATMFTASVPSPDLFHELRQMILTARAGDCLQEADLLALYRGPDPAPIPCAVLAHLVSCERCLATVDSHSGRPKLGNRDSFDGLDSRDGKRGKEERTAVSSDARTVMRKIMQHERRIFEHRPAALSIAVNGRITALHEVQGERSFLSARLERPETASFVEVFTDQDIRLALLPIEALPPEGPHALTQHTELSDGRWLKLRVAFDGLGMSSEVSYFDPVLAFDSFHEMQDEAILPIAVPETSQTASTAIPRKIRAVPALAAVTRAIHRLYRIPRLSWAFSIMLVLLGMGYLTYRFYMRPLSAQKVLNESISAEAASLQGKATHVTLEFEAVDANGQELAEGTVDEWKDGSGRQMRRLYDSRQRLITAEWEGNDGVRGEFSAKGSLSDDDRQLVSGGIWNIDVSAYAFRAVAEQSVASTSDHSGYQLTSEIRDKSHPQVVSATLIINRRFLATGEILRIRAGGSVHEVRLMQTKYESRPSGSVPDTVFGPPSEEGEYQSDQAPQSLLAPSGAHSGGLGAESNLVELQIGVLYKLYQLHSDTSEPIQVVRTPNHRLRVEGGVSSKAQEHAIVAALESLPNHQALELRLTAGGEEGSPRLAGSQSPSRPVTIYDVRQTKAPSDPVIRRYFATLDPRKPASDSDVSHYEADVLGNARRALQQAYSLDRLGSAFSAQELQSGSLTARQEWAQMVSGHGQALLAELDSLQDRMAKLEPDRETTQAKPAVELRIEDPAEFARDAQLLFEHTQALNQDLGLVFAAGPSNADQGNPDLLILDAEKEIPLPEAVGVSGFAVRLSKSEGAERDDRAEEPSSAQQR